MGETEATEDVETAALVRQVIEHRVEAALEYVGLQELCAGRSVAQHAAFAVAHILAVHVRNRRAEI